MVIVSKPSNDAQTPKLTLKALLEPKYQKNLKFELGEKLEHRFMVKFHRQSNGDCLEALKRCLDPKMGHRSLVYGQKSINSKFRLGKSWTTI